MPSNGIQHHINNKDFNVKNSIILWGLRIRMFGLMMMFTKILRNVLGCARLLSGAISRGFRRKPLNSNKSKICWFLFVCKFRAFNIQHHFHAINFNNWWSISEEFLNYQEQMKRNGTKIQERCEGIDGSNSTTFSNNQMSDSIKLIPLN